MAEARNPADAVVAGWLAFEEAAARRGWVREPQETTTEFTARLLSSSPAPAQPVATLRSLYQQVRFGSQIPTDDDVAAARTALADIATHIDKLPQSVPAAPDNSSEAASNSATLETSPPITRVKRNKWGED